LTKQDGYIPFEIVQKIIKGETLTKNDIPSIISEYFSKYPQPTPNYELRTTYYSLFRALSPWPGLWTLIPGNKRLKITGMELQDKKPVITKVQLEGKKEVDIKTFQRAYSLH
jgi:hypothetical protein